MNQLSDTENTPEKKQILEITKLEKEIENLNLKNEDVLKDRRIKQIDLVIKTIQIIIGVILIYLTTIFTNTEKKELNQQIAEKQGKIVSQDSTLKLNALKILTADDSINSLKMAKDSFQSRTLEIKKEYDSIESRSNFLNKQLILKEGDRKKIQQELITLDVAKQHLEVELKLLPFSNYFAGVRLNPYNYGNIDRFVNNYNDAEFLIKNMIDDSLRQLKSNIDLKALISVLQYKIHNQKKYFNELLVYTDELLDYNKNRNDQYNNPYINDSTDKIKKQYHTYEYLLVNLLGQPFWTIEQKLIITKHVVEKLTNYYVNNDFYNNLLNVPGHLNYELNFDLLNLDTDIFLDYISLNLKLIETNHLALRYKDNGSFFYKININDQIEFVPDSAVVSKTLYDSITYSDSKDFNNRMACLYNIALFSPQIYVAFKLKCYYLFYNLSSQIDFNTFNKVPEYFLYPAFQEISNAGFFNTNFAFTSEICDSILNNITGIASFERPIQPTNSYKTIADYLPELIKKYIETYQERKTEMDQWLDPDLAYFRNNRGVLKDKIMKRDF